MDEGDGEGERGVRMSEEEISMVLNTFMYIDYKEADDGMTLKESFRSFPAIRTVRRAESISGSTQC